MIQGDHGYIEGYLKNGRLKSNFVPFACRSYKQILLMLPKKLHRYLWKEAESELA